MPIPRVDPTAYDFARLERAVASLAAEQERARKENGSLRVKIAGGAERIRTLEEQLLVANQRRKDVAKRIDELIAQIDQLDAQLGSLDR